MKIMNIKRILKYTPMQTLVRTPVPDQKWIILTNYSYIYKLMSDFKKKNKFKFIFRAIVLSD